MPVYLDCNATTPLDPAVRAKMLEFFDVEYGNAGSRTHLHGATAKKAVERARGQVAAAAGAKLDEVVFTSGATEANNLAILGLAPFGVEAGRRHVVTTTIEHKAVAEPVDALEARGFEVTRVGVGASGRVDPAAVLAAVRSDTLLVSVMHANNETGVVQPIGEIAAGLDGHAAYLHVDAAQGFGKEPGLENARIDLVGISGHKVYGPKGVGALVMRRRRFKRPPLTPLMYGGGQEKKLRPGTLPVPLIVALGEAAERAVVERSARRAACERMRADVLACFDGLGGQYNGDQAFVQPHVVNVSVPGVASEAAMVALKDVISISNGSACTSSSYEPSHVLVAMGLGKERIMGALRISWSHLSEPVDWQAVRARLEILR